MKKLICALFLSVSALTLQASVDGYFMLSLFSPGQLPVPMTHLYGGRITAFYGECQELFGLDVGGVGRVRERMYGAQIGLGHIVGTDGAGLQAGLVEFAESDFYGLQIGLWNDIAGHAGGCQLGLYNQALHISGVQVGLVNVADTMSGVQLGLLNVARQHDWGVLPFLTVRW